MLIVTEVWFIIVIVHPAGWIHIRVGHLQPFSKIRWSQIWLWILENIKKRFWQNECSPINIPCYVCSIPLCHMNNKTPAQVHQNDSFHIQYQIVLQQSVKKSPLYTNVKTIACFIVEMLMCMYCVIVPFALMYKIIIKGL